MPSNKSKEQRLAAKPPKISTAELLKIFAERHSGDYWVGVFEAQPRLRQQVLDHIRVERQIEKAAYRLDELELIDKDTELGESDGGNECILALQQLLKNLRSTQLAKERVLAPVFKASGSARAGAADPLAFMDAKAAGAAAAAEVAPAVDPESGEEYEGFKEGDGDEDGPAKDSPLP